MNKQGDDLFTKSCVKHPLISTELLQFLTPHDVVQLSKINNEFNEYFLGRSYEGKKVTDRW